ncbi:MAG: PaaX domain-containing protein, C- domain protein [Mycobacterium sp.]|nr:PaaX domain-containing protein, C- domain protein [Mycobacterium sp.]
MTARSVVLSVLLGAHPAWATAAELLRLTEGFGIREATLRVALTRMVSSGDLVRSDDGYRLSRRLLARQRRQDAALQPVTRDWDGSWLTVVITAVGADARARASMRTALLHSRFGELREGVWMRPDNLDEPLPGELRQRARILHSRDDAPATLAAALWDLPGWSRAGSRLLREMDRAGDIPDRFAVAAAMVRLLLTDPVLPAELLPVDWPADRLRAAYADFAAFLATRRSEDLQEVR